MTQQTMDTSAQEMGEQPPAAGTRPWVTPTFERESMNDALTAVLFTVSLADLSGCS